MAVFRCKRELGSVVFLKNATERTPLILTNVSFAAGGGYFYAATYPDGTANSHYECELVDEWTGYLPDGGDDQGEVE